MKSLNILLVNPSQKFVYGFPIPQPYPPLGLMSIAAVIEKSGHTVRLLDIDTEDYDDKDIIGLVKELKPVMVGISATTPTFDSALSVAGLIKRYFQTKIIIGGIHPTIAPEESISHSEVDAIVIGEGEITITEIINAFENNDGNFSGIKGVWYKRNGEIIRNPNRELIKDLNGLPYPARHLLKKPGRYRPADAIQPPVTSIITSRGCPFNCTFCCTKNIFGRQVRLMTADRIIEEILYCVGKFGIQEFHIADDCFTVSKKRTLEFCGKIKALNKNLRFIFMNGLRADLVDREILLALKSIGVRDVGYGVESGNAEILKHIKKGITMDKIKETFKLSREIGFATWAFFIIGLPGETRSTVGDTLRFAKELNPDFAKFLILKPYPGSEVYYELDKNGYILDRNYAHYGVYTAPVHRLKDLTAEEIQQLQNRAYRSYYLRPKVIFRHIMRIRSLSQLGHNLKAAVFVFRKMFQ